MIPFNGPLTGYIPPSWNANDKDILLTLSVNNTHVKKPSGAGTVSGCRSVISKTSGKFHIEHSMVTVLSSINADTSLGLATGSSAVINSSNHIGAASGSAGLYSGDGSIHVNGTTTIAAGIPFVSGDMVIMEWDMAAKLAWWCVYHSSAYSSWNGSGTANPATGVGGVDISSIIGGPLFAAAVVQQATSEFQTNFGLSAFFKTPSAGFGSFLP